MTYNPKGPIILRKTHVSVGLKGAIQLDPVYLVFFQQGATALTLTCKLHARKRAHTFSDIPLAGVGSLR